jgi:hypothetical protein
MRYNLRPRSANYAVARAANRTMARVAGRAVSRFVPYVGAAMSAYDIGRSAYKAVTRGTQKSKSTGKSFKRRRLGNTLTTSSSGRFKRGRRSKASPTAVYNKYGVTETLEQGGVMNSGVQTATANNTIVIGHATLPTDRIVLMLMRALVKKLFVAVGIHEVPDFNARIPGMVVGDFVYLQYYNNENTATISTVFYTGLGTAADTYEAVAVKLFDDLSAFATSVQQLQFINVQFIPGATQNRLKYFVMPLETAFVHLYGKSDLKMQNRTVNDAGDDADDVDNVPLQGRSYSGTGNGTGAINRNNLYSGAARDFIAGETYGTIAKVPTERWYQEPPGPEVFQSVKTSAKVKLDPGSLKTSCLITKTSISLNKFVKAVLVNTFAPTDGHHRHYLGQYRFFMFEKMITSLAGAEARNMLIAYETNLELGCYVTNKREITTAPLNKLHNFATQA